MDQQPVADSMSELVSKAEAQAKTVEAIAEHNKSRITEAHYHALRYTASLLKEMANHIEALEIELIQEGIH